jgi:type I restriction-modification system DNA methylase subunit
MTKYDNLDARTELEQVITADFVKALTKRGFMVTHNGSKTNCAPGGLTDIQAISEKIIINIEVTKLKKSSQDREFQSIRDHLMNTKTEKQKHKCFCLFIAPETSQRTIDSIKDHNNQREKEGKPDMRILPMDFMTCEILTKKLIEAEASVYSIDSFIYCFKQHQSFIDDLRIRKLIINELFPEDEKLSDEVRRQETEHDETTLEELIRDLTKTENYMRENGIATGSHAIENLIFLVFLKLYEEKREKDKGIPNRLRSVERYEGYRQDQGEELVKKGRCIHHLFETIKADREFKQSKLFTEFDKLRDEVDDKFMTSYILPIFEEYNFYGTKLDALGAVYEVLALRAEKDVKVGQFFTPENVVKFIVDLAELHYTDRVLDPACGTGRFLIHAMHEMQHKLKRSGEKSHVEKDEHIRQHQCFGADIDTRIAKIAKMNMWIHGDGKSNIFGGKDYNGLLLYKKGFNGEKTFDNKFDVILTNPPLGELNYQVLELFESKPAEEQKRIKEKLSRVPILPHKNLTQERLNKKIEAIAKYKMELEEFERLKNDGTLSIKDLKQLESKIKSKKKVIEINKVDIKQIEAELLTGKVEYEITGNNLKGGAMFMTAIWHYLKDVSNKDELPEWRGGKTLIVLDEGVLNTDDYKQVRNFIRNHFYVKAVISLTRDTFMPISKTSTKTSILYAIKKSDLDAVQKEPIFFAHVEQVGLDTVGKVCANDLPRIAGSFFNFRKVIKASYSGKIFSKDKFQQLTKHGDI